MKLSAARRAAALKERNHWSLVPVTVSPTNGTLLGTQKGDFVRSLHEKHGVIFRLDDRRLRPMIIK
jgi:hypothetical protein